MRLPDSVAVALAVVAAVPVAAAGATRPDETCTAARKTVLQADAAAFAKQMPATRSAYFRTHTRAKARAAFVKAQAAKLAALERTAACTVAQPGSGGVTSAGPLPPPTPTANEHFVFTDEIPQWARDEIEGDIAYAAQDEQALLHVDLGELNVFVSSDQAWLAQHQCAFWGRAGDCVASTQSSYAGGNTVQDGPRAIFIDWQTPEWTFTNPDAVWVRQKIAGHEVCTVLQYQLDGRAGNALIDVGPAWLFFGSAEMVGYRVASDRNLHPYSESLKIMRLEARISAARLQDAETWDGVSQIALLGADHWFLAAAGDRLVSDAANGIRSIADYYAAIGGGEAWADAFASSFGLSLDAFYADFTAYRTTL